MFVRIIFFMILVILASAGPVPVFVLAVAVYTFLYEGYEILLLAVGIDAYFGYNTGYSYTLGFGVLLLAAHLMRPRLFM